MTQLSVPGINPRADVLTVTPDLAKEWLDRNVHNRPVRKNKVVNYARDMQAGNWALNGEAVKFAVDGVLLDGQHRLHGVIAANVPVQMLVVTGLANDTQTTMDSGVKRTTGDALGLEGQKNSQMLAAILKKIWMWEQGDYRFTANYTPTTAECAELLNSHPEIHRSVEIAMHSRNTFRPLPPSIVGAAHYVFSKVDQAQAVWFFARVADGAGLVPGHPILALRTRVTNESMTGATTHPHQRMAYLIRAWNAVRQGRPLARIQQGPKDPMPMPK